MHKPRRDFQKGVNEGQEAAWLVKKRPIPVGLGRVGKLLAFQFRRERPA